VKFPTAYTCRNTHIPDAPADAGVVRARTGFGRVAISDELNDGHRCGLLERRPSQKNSTKRARLSSSPACYSLDFAALGVVSVLQSRASWRSCRSCYRSHGIAVAVRPEQLWYFPPMELNISIAPNWLVWFRLVKSCLHQPEKQKITLSLLILFILPSL
jgi:hypothetical protein